MTYKYDDQGQRVIKRGPQGETVYVNQFFTVRNREAGTKHVFAGPTRAVSKLMKQPQSGSTPPGGANNANNPHSPVEKDLYFYHPDHVGSSAYITDTRGDLYQHLEYFPFGETWVEESSNTQRTPYLFTGKELDEETGLYYFGARYYDPRTSVWVSADPILGKYLNGSPAGGVFTPPNLNLYGYAHQRPVMLVDPNGEYTLEEARQSLKTREIPMEGKRFFGVVSVYSPPQVFGEWLRLEKNDTAWRDELPACPAMCSAEEGYLPPGGGEIWEPLNEAGRLTKEYHPGAEWEMRSSPMENGSGNQCIYDSNCSIMTDIPAAGSADRISPSGQWLGGYFMGSEGHVEQDVDPYNLAVELDRVEDYYSVRPIIVETE